MAAQDTPPGPWRWTAGGGGVEDGLLAVRLPDLGEEALDERDRATHGHVVLDGPGRAVRPLELHAGAAPGGALLGERLVVGADGEEALPQRRVVRVRELLRVP